MDIESLIAGKEVAAAAGAAGLAAAGALGRWLYRRAKAREEGRRQKAEGRSMTGGWVLLALLPVVSGCAVWDAGVIGIGDALGAGRERVAPGVPAGYEIVWDVFNAEGIKQEVAGWYRVPRIVAKEGTRPPPVVIEIPVWDAEDWNKEGAEGTEEEFNEGGGSTNRFEELVERVERVLEQVPE